MGTGEPDRACELKYFPIENFRRKGRVTLGYRFSRLPGIEFAFGWQSNLLHPRHVVSTLFCSSHYEQKFQA